tara:strand:- start:54327 stop:55319 length:993 start_codon:yes stop_codon:yes gene_type:complete
MDEQAPPEDRVLRKVLSEIIDGYTKIYLRGEDVFVKHFSNNDQRLLEDNYKQVFDKAKKNGLPTEEETLGFLIEEGIWSHQEEGEINELKLYLDNLSNTKKNLIIPSQIEKINQDISDSNKKLNESMSKRSSLFTSTCESYSSNKNNDYSIYLSFYKDQNLNEAYFTWDEFCETSKSELQSIFANYLDKISHLSIGNIKHLSISNVFSIYYNILGQENIHKFFNKNIYSLSYYQLNLLNYAKILNSIIENVENVPESIKQDPDELLSFAESKNRNKEVKERGKDKQGFSVMGATKKDMGEMGVSNETDVSPFDLAKKKGSLTIEDFQNFS